jgi:serine/threonine protein kinase
VESVLDEFTEVWEKGLAPTAERYLERLDAADSRAAIELIYREYCLAEAAGQEPQEDAYLARFPDHAEALKRLLGLHRACSPSLVGGWVAAASVNPDLPNAGDAIGPYVLRRELGRGGFARVFLAEQSNLENRLVVVKVTTRPTREPWLLARVRHAHIVEILSHAMVDDGALQFQMICMPFWGGATLAAVLAGRRLRTRQQATGADLLADLDAVAAAEYPAVHPARPAREILASLSYDQAVAWIGARLAEALDHAYNRDVAHGDVKPSNILLSADGSPMLLDFNLARDGSPTGGGVRAGDMGGTLAYMAPERLRALAARSNPPGHLPAAGDRDRDAQPDRPTDTGAAESASEHAAHHADIYALGVVLLEAATGSPPGQPMSPPDPPGSAPGSIQTAATACAAHRGRGARALIRESEKTGGRRLSPGLRSILERCLDPEATGRYSRAWELAQDLDWWRTDRPLVFTAETFWGQALPRSLRRYGRQAAVITMAVVLAVGLPGAGALWVNSLANREATALFKLARLWDDPEARAYRFQRQQAIRLVHCNLSQFEAAARALKEYDVLGPDDWRQRDDVRYLPRAEAEDLEVWLLGQGYLYCRTLAERPGSPEDWRRASKILDYLGGSSPPPVLAAMRQRLGDRLAGEETSGRIKPTRSSKPGPPSWVNEYLLGIQAECDSEPDSPDASTDPGAVEILASDRAADGRGSGDRVRRSADRALGHYRNLLAAHPRSYWGHYRAAATAFSLGDIAETVAHLEACLNRRPRNPTLQGQLATCLAELNLNREALQEVEKAIDGAPDLAEFYRTRAYIQTTLGQVNGPGLARDLQHFEVLRHALPRRLWGFDLDGPAQPLAPGTAHRSPREAALDFRGLVGLETPDLDDNGGDAEIDHEEIAARAALASRISNAGLPQLAALELGKILVLDPDEIAVRMSRAILSIEARRFEDAQRDIELVLANSGLFEHLKKDPAFIRRFHHAARRYLTNGKHQEGRAIARRALDLALAAGLPPAESHFNLARAYAVSARTDSRFVAPAADQLYKLFVAHPANRRFYTEDRAFDPVREQIDAVLHQKPDAAGVHRQRLLTRLEVK